jgi:hypothetical protein
MRRRGEEEEGEEEEEEEEEGEGIPMALPLLRADGRRPPSSKGIREP